ncbi:hypothetical protein BJ912DRAFT_944855 [Pholiota molesta]|nr:hypothetical protein BJ912DRAFT_944855 [Pholiota molesta]
MSTLPLEITEKIISTLADDDPRLVSTKACALVCHEFNRLCRKHIFASIYLNDKQPQIGGYIRNLTYAIHPDDVNDVSLVQTFKKITRLKFLCIRLSPGFNLSWINNPLRPALLHLLHLPTLLHFRLYQVNDFLVSDLAPCINLEHFEFSNITVFEANDISVSNPPDSSIRLRQISARIEGPVQCADGTPFLDFNSLASLSVNVLTSPDVEASRTLFSQCKNLTDADICAEEWINWTQMGLFNMLRPSMHTLKNLRVDMTYGIGTGDPLGGFPVELEAMQNHNVIETVAIQVYIEVDIASHWDFG